MCRRIRIIGKLLILLERLLEKMTGEFSVRYTRIRCKINILKEDVEGDKWDKRDRSENDALMRETRMKTNN